MTIALSKKGAEQPLVLAITGSVPDAAAAVQKTKAALADLEAQIEASDLREQDAIERTLAGEGDEAAEAAANAETARLRSRKRPLLALLARQEQRLADAKEAAKAQGEQDWQRALKALLSKTEDAYRDLDSAITAFACAFYHAVDADHAVRDFLGAATRPEMNRAAFEFASLRLADLSPDNLLGPIPLSSRPQLPGAADSRMRRAATVQRTGGSDFAAQRSRHLLETAAGEKPAPMELVLPAFNVFSTPPAERPGGIVEVLANADPTLSDASFLKRYNIDRSALPANVLEAAAKRRAQISAAPPPVEAAPALPAPEPAQPAPPRPSLSPEDIAKAKAAFASARHSKDRRAVRAILDAATGIKGADPDLVLPERLESFLAELAALPALRA
jgi:hypothetical protein